MSGGPSYHLPLTLEDLAEGMSVWDVAGILGADATTVERTYGHYMPIEERKRA